MINFDIKDRKLKNGLRLITLKKSGELSSFNLGFKGGSYEDEDEIKGVTHFLEHMIFNGTKNLTHDDLNEKLEFLGGDVDAYTDLDSMVLSITVLNSELNNAINLASDMILNSIFLEEEIEKERNIIYNEYKEGQDDIENITFEKLYDYAFKEKSLKYNVIGNEKTIHNIKREDLLKRKDSLLVPNKAVMVIISPKDHFEVERIITKEFSNWKSLDDSKVETKALKNSRGTKETLIDSFEMGSVSFLYTFPKLPLRYELPLKIINNKLGNSDNSLLLKEVRLKRGLAYDIYSNLELSPNLKALEIYCSLDNNDVIKVKNIIKDTIKMLIMDDNIVDERTLELMRKVYNTDSAAISDDTSSMGNYMLGNALEGRNLLLYLEELKELESLTPELIKEVIEYVFKNPTVHILKTR